MQVVSVANAFYRGQERLVLLWIDPERLRSTVKYEPPAHPKSDHPPETDSGERFPHVYGPIQVDAVVRVVDFLPDAEGLFVLPEGIQDDDPP